MKLRSFSSILISVVVGLLVVAAIGFAWLFSQSPLKLLTSGQVVTPAAAIFVPKQAPAMVSLLVNPEQLEQFRLALATPGERRQARAELQQLRQSLLANTGLEYERDVKPWLGQELTLAITTLDIDRDPTNGKQPGYLVALATQDAAQSGEFLQLFWQKRAIAGADLVFEQYNGVKLIYGNTGDTTSKPESASKRQSTSPKKDQNLWQPAALLTDPSLATAVVGDRFVLFANHPKVLRDAINNVQAAELNLSNADLYRKALESLPDARIGLSFVNLPGLADWLGSDTLPPQAGNRPGTVTPVYKTLAIALKLERGGLLAETALLGNQTGAIAPSLSQPVGALTYLPASSPLAAGGSNLSRLWSGVEVGTTGYPTIAQLIHQPLKDLQSRWQIDLPQDIFNWVQDEYAVGLVPTANGQIVAPPAQKQGKRAKNAPKTKVLDNDWVFVAQRTASDTAKQAIERLDAIAQKQGLSVGPITLGNQTVSAWTRLTAAGGKKNAAPALQADVRGVHTTVGNYEIFATSVAAMEQALQAANQSLASSDRFQQAIAPIRQPNNGYFYLDWQTAQPLLAQRIPLLKVVELAGKPLFTHLRSLTVSSYGSQSNVQRGSMFIKLASH